MRGGRRSSATDIESRYSLVRARDVGVDGPEYKVAMSSMCSMSSDEMDDT